MATWKKAIWYLQHRLKARSHGDAPFVKSLVKQVLPHRSSDAGKQIARIHAYLKQDLSVLTYEDLGAGQANRGEGTATRVVADLARISSRGRKDGVFLHRLCGFLAPKTCLELGTHLGISTLYQASAVPQSRFVSIEGAAPVAAVAKQTLGKFSPALHIDLRIGDFDQVLDALWQEGFSPDYVLVDGNHRYEPTIRYAKALISHMPSGSCILFDDIYWSEEMKRAWEDIIRWPEVSLSIDLYHLGLIFIHQDAPKAHVVLKSGW